MRVVDIDVFTEDALVVPPPGATHFRVALRGGSASDGTPGETVTALAAAVATMRFTTARGGYALVEWLEEDA